MGILIYQMLTGGKPFKEERELRVVTKNICHEKIDFWEMVLDYRKIGSMHLKWFQSRFERIGSFYHTLEAFPTNDIFMIFGIRLFESNNCHF